MKRSEKRDITTKRKISWTRRCEDGVKREVRVTVSRGGIKWQFKRADEERWDYDSAPTEEEWNALEEILGRRMHRGRGFGQMESVRSISPSPRLKIPLPNVNLQCDFQVREIP